MVPRETLRQKVSELIEVLYNHLHEHRELTKLLEDKKRAMVEMRSDDIEVLNRSEEERITNIGLVEAERVALATELGEMIGVENPIRLRIRELILYVDQDQVDTLLELRDSLRDVADRLRRLNDINRTLAVHSVEHIHLFVSLLSGMDPNEKVYTPKGTQQTGPVSLIDRKA